MSHLNPGLLGAYNSLTDRHLTTYFNNTRIRRHLQKVGLLSRSGRIIPEKEYRHKLIQRTHQRHVRECLAQAIFHKVLDMERLHQIEIKRKLEEFARRQRVNKIKVERSNRYEEDPIMMLSPRPPTGPKMSHARHSGPEGEHSESSESPGSSRPNTAPGKMQRPVRLKPLNRTNTPGSLKQNSSRYRHLESSNETDHPFSSLLERDATRHLTLTDFSSIVSPYRLPVINNYVTPVPPLTKRKEKGLKANGTLRGRRLRPTTAPSAADTQEGTIQRASAQGAVSVKMVYFGKSVHLSHDLMDLTDEVKVFQQHCGGENLCVYKGKLKEGETFQFVSRRHRGFPFSLTFFLNGLQVERLSSCCEFKHRKGSRLGGRHGHFGFIGVEGATPCYRCIITMGLDKKPIPPKRMKEDAGISTSQENSVDVDVDVEQEEKLDTSQSQEMQTERKDDATQQETKSRNDYEEDFEADEEGPLEHGAEEGHEAAREEEEETGPKGNEADNEAEDSNKKNYEEDFEADDEGPMEHAEEEGNEAKPSPTREEEQKAETKEENENEVAEKNQDSDSKVEDSDKNEMEKSPPISSRLSSGSSSREKDKSEGGPQPGEEEEVPEENLEPERAESPLTSEKDTNIEEMEEMETSSVSLPQQTEKESQTQDGLMEKSEVEISEETERDERAGEKPAEVATEYEAKDEENEVEPEKAKSVQEKLAEAILSRSECSSEPELSDTTTEEDEVASIRTMQNSPGAEPLDPTHESEMIDGDADTQKPSDKLEEDIQEKPTDKLEEDTKEPPQPESKTEDEEKNTEAIEETCKNQEEEKEEQSAGEEQRNSGDVKTEEFAMIDGDKQEEEIGVTKEKDEANEESEMAGEPENKKTEVGDDSSVQEPEKEDETEHQTSAEESGETQPEAQNEDPVEEAIADTETDNNTSQNETENQEQTEEDTVNAKNGEEATGEQASDEDKMKAEVSADEGETTNAINGDENDNSDELKDKETSEGLEEVEEGNKTDDKSMVQEEISEEVEVSKGLEVTEGEKQVEDIVEEAEENVKHETESTPEKYSDVVDESETAEDSKDTSDDKTEEEVNKSESVKEDETESGEKTEKDDGQSEAAAEEHAEAEDDSKSGNANTSEVKENESIKEEITEDATQPEETESKDQGTEVATQHENDQNDELEKNGLSENEGNEETKEDDGENDAEFNEGLEGANIKETAEEQDPQTEEAQAEKVVDEETEPENTDKGKDEKILKEEMAEERTKQESTEEINPTTNLELIETQQKEAEAEVEEPEHDARNGETKLTADEDPEFEEKSSNDVKLVEEVNQNESVTENVTEETVVGEDMDSNKDGEENTEVGMAKTEKQEEPENDEIEQEKDIKQKEDDLQEATVGREKRFVETDTENSGEDVVIANGEIKMEDEAKTDEGEATFEEANKETNQTEQKSANDEESKDEQDDNNMVKEEVSPKATSDADVEENVPSKANHTVEEPADTESEGIDNNLENKEKGPSIAGHDNQVVSHAAKAENLEVVAEDTNGEGGTSSPSPSEESQPAEKVMALKKEDRESSISEEKEILVTPSADQRDLVSNWVNIHQASKYFEKFVDPADDMKSLASHEGERWVKDEAGEEAEGVSTNVSESGDVVKTSETVEEDAAGTPWSNLESLKDNLVESNQSWDIKPLSDSEGGLQREDAEAKELASRSVSSFASGGLQAVTVDNIINLSETPAMTSQINQTVENN